MQRRHFLRNLGLLSGAAALPIHETMAASSAVFAPTGISGKVSDGAKGMANVQVSDGYSVVRTAKDGSFSFPAHPNAEFVFICVPSGYEIPHNKGIAAFYQPLDKNKNQQRADFTLSELKMNDARHAFIVWGDTQIQNEQEAEWLKTLSAPDTRDTIRALHSVPVHGIACGDLVFDKFDLYKDYKQAVETTGIPFYQVIGNHDMDYSARSDDGSQATFKSHFGPTYYSFNRGRIHYVTLDNVFFIGAGHRYIGYIPEAQLSWLQKDLQSVPKGSTVVVSLHIPTNNAAKQREQAREESISGVTANREALYEMLKDYQVHIMSGHTHFNENWEKDNMMEHNHGTVCGAWWSGPVCGDGTPNGYGIYQVDGDRITWQYKSVGFAPDHQIMIHSRGSDPKRADAIIANVWNWDPKWTVEWQENGEAKGTMQQYTGMDPQAEKLYAGAEMPTVHKWVEPDITDHLFAAVPSSLAKSVTVKATDRFGNVYTATHNL